jgi:hypothetical protein
MTRECDPRRSCREDQEPEPDNETEQEPGLKATYPIGPSSTIDPARLGLSFTACLSGNPSVVLAILWGYLGIRTVGRNAAPLTVPALEQENPA